MGVRNKAWGRAEGGGMRVEADVEAETQRWGARVSGKHEGRRQIAGPSPFAAVRETQCVVPAFLSVAFDAS